MSHLASNTEDRFSRIAAQMQIPVPVWEQLSKDLCQAVPTRILYSHHCTFTSSVLVVLRLDSCLWITRVQLFKTNDVVS